MLIRSVKLVVSYEEEASTLILGDLRRFVDATKDAPDADVKIEAGVLYDGKPADTLYAEWTQQA